MASLKVLFLDGNLESSVVDKCQKGGLMLIFFIKEKLSIDYLFTSFTLNFPLNVIHDQK